MTPEKYSGSTNASPYLWLKGIVPAYYWPVCKFDLIIGCSKQGCALWNISRFWYIRESLFRIQNIESYSRITVDLWSSMHRCTPSGMHLTCCSWWHLLFSAVHFNCHHYLELPISHIARSLVVVETIVIKFFCSRKCGNFCWKRPSKKSYFVLNSNRLYCTLQGWL